MKRKGKERKKKNYIDAKYQYSRFLYFVKREFDSSHEMRPNFHELQIIEK